MKRDFTNGIYHELVASLKHADYTLFPFFESFSNGHKTKKYVIIRHDVDRLPGNALTMARMENEAGVRATYFFRTIPETFKPQIIKEIADLGHEIGYHYEDLVLSSRGWRVGRDKWEGLEVGGRRTEDRGRKSEVRSQKELFELAILNFELNLEKLRELYPVKTICMHGSPLSKYDNRELWEKYDYRDFGIIAEPYFDVDYDEVFYLTDTGRRWDGDRVSVRDKVVKAGVRCQVSGVRKGQMGEVGGWRLEDRKGRMGEVGGWRLEDRKGRMGEVGGWRLEDRKGRMGEVGGWRAGRDRGWRVEVGGWRTQQREECLAQSRKDAKKREKNAGVKELETKKKGRNFDNLRFRSTFDIISAAETGDLPDKIMINVHPQRWTNDYVPWVKELVAQNLKNVVKRALVKRHNYKC